MGNFTPLSVFSFSGRTPGPLLSDSGRTPGPPFSVSGRTPGPLFLVSGRTPDLKKCVDETTSDGELLCSIAAFYRAKTNHNNNRMFSDLLIENYSSMKRRMM